MRRIVLSLVTVAAMLFISLPAHAAGTLTRTFVSSAGVDTNPCTTAAPCATFAAAYAAVASNGIVAALDPGKYGPLTITGPVTIDGNGWASITAPASGSGIGILIQAGTSDAVILRGLTIDGAGTGGPGIDFQVGGSLTVMSCVTRNMATSADGLDVANFSSSPMTLAVTDSHFINSDFGVYIATESSGSVTASFVQTEASGNGQYGLVVDGTQGTGALTVAVSDSIAANNATGFRVFSVPNRSVSNLMLTNTQAVVNTSIGIQASGANAALWVAHSTIAGNGLGFNGGIINSFGDNYFADNGNSNNAGSLTPVGTQ